jgi:hypothetical protein
MSRMRIVDPSRGMLADAESGPDAEDPSARRSSASSYHLTHLSCFSLTESKHIGQRAHFVFSEVFK